MGAHAQTPTPDGESAGLIRRARYRLFRPLDSGHGLWPWALAHDGVPTEGKSSRGRPERSVAKSKGDEVGAPGSARGNPLAGPRACPPLEGPITGFMWTCLRATHRQAPGTRRTSCHEPRNRNRDAAWMVTSAFFSLKTPSLSKSRACSPLRSQRTTPSRNTPVPRNTLVPNMMCQVCP